MTLKERLILFLEYAEMGQGRFEKHVGFSNGQINNIGDGISTTSLIKILEKYPELNATWLLTERGEMILKEKSGSSTEPDHYLQTLLNTEIEVMRASLDKLSQAASKTVGSSPTASDPVQDLPLGKRTGKDQTGSNKGRQRLPSGNVSKKGN